MAPRWRRRPVRGLELPSALCSVPSHGGRGGGRGRALRARPVSFPLTGAHGGCVRRPSWQRRLLVGGTKRWATGTRSPASRRAGGGARRPASGRADHGGGARRTEMEGREREGGRLERKEEKEQMGEDKNIQGDFCKYLPLCQHVACHVGFGRLCGALGTSDETLNRV